MTKRILIVEDNMNNMRLMKELLDDVNQETEDNIQLLCASSGQSAIDISKDTPISLVLMDMSLPDMNGIEVTQKLKTYTHLQEIPFIIVTAYAMEHDILLFREIFDDYISKPIDDELFICKIKEWI